MGGEGVWLDTRPPLDPPGGGSRTTLTPQGGGTPPLGGQITLKTSKKAHFGTILIKSIPPWGVHPLGDQKLFKMIKKWLKFDQNWSNLSHFHSNLTFLNILDKMIKNVTKPSKLIKNIRFRSFLVFTATPMTVLLIVNHKSWIHNHNYKLKLKLKLFIQR